MLSELNPPRWIYQLLEWWECSWTFPRIHCLQQSRFSGQLKAKQSKLHFVNFTSVSNCWSTEAGQSCSKQFEKLWDIKHTNILINYLFRQALKMSTAQPRCCLSSSSVSWFCSFFLFNSLKLDNPAPPDKKPHSKWCQRNESQDTKHFPWNCFPAAITVCSYR